MGSDQVQERSQVSDPTPTIRIEWASLLALSGGTHRIMPKLGSGYLGYRAVEI